MKKINMIFISASLLINVMLVAQAGALDAGFGNGGIVITHSAFFNDLNAIVIQPDGKIVGAGYSGNYQFEDFAVVRYNPNGSLDNTFGTGGKVTTSLVPGEDRAKAVLLQSDGKIILAGYADNGGDIDFAIVRYMPNGALDMSFGTGGIVITNINSTLDYAFSAVLQPDGKILLAGNSGSDIVLARYNADGSFDTSFGTNGIVITDIAGYYDIAFKVLLQPDGKIIAAGYSGQTMAYDFLIVRYLANGTLDNSFGTGGKTLTPIGTTEDIGKSAVLQPDGKIVVGGYYWDAAFTDIDFGFARYTTNGILDVTFGNGGTVMTSISTTHDLLGDVAIQPDGKILGTGQVGAAPNADFGLIRLNSDGSLDTSFNSTGKVTTELGANDQDGAVTIAIQADGKIVIAGSTAVSAMSDMDIAMARYLPGPDVGVINFTIDNNAVFIYPNPVSSNATIAYTLTQAEKISIDITDIEGRLVSAVISNELQQAGKHMQAFEMPEIVAHGTYLLLLSTSQGKVSVKFVK
jgi:uncharacterized delta-60 repeat protein